MPNLEERALIDDRFNDAAHLVRRARVVRDRFEEPRVAAHRIVPARPARRQVVDRRRHVGEEAARAGEGLFFRVHRVVDAAGLERDLPAAELVLRQLLAEPLDHRRSRHEQRRLVLDHHRVVGGGQVGGAEPGHRAEAERHPRNDADVGHDPFPAVDGRHVGAPRRLDGLDRAAAAGAFHQANERESQVVSHPLAHVVLALDGRVRGAAAHGEVVAADDDRAALDAGAAEDEVRRRERLEVVLVVVGGAAGDLAELVEAARIGQPIDALTDRQPAAVGH